MTHTGPNSSGNSPCPTRSFSFSFSHLKFLDSMGFLNASLDTLVNNLHDNGKGKDKFKHSIEHCSKLEHLDMLLKKGVYP